mmetsp:Transcript_28042/g.24773  ORF Transcript_28042/g.24773 Transcript_28042/m.24773 type:complete len:173 (+) Transcript_28042:270-788(+)
MLKMKKVVLQRKKEARNVARGYKRENQMENRKSSPKKMDMMNNNRTNVNFTVNTENSELHMYGTEKPKLKSESERSKLQDFKIFAKKGSLNSTIAEKLPIFHSFSETSLLIDFFKNRHSYFSRHMRWSLIFLSIFLSILQVVCLLSIFSYTEISQTNSMMTYSLSKIWISFI